MMFLLAGGKQHRKVKLDILDCKQLTLCKYYSDLGIKNRSGDDV